MRIKTSWKSNHFPTNVKKILSTPERFTVPFLSIDKPPDQTDTGRIHRKNSSNHTSPKPNMRSTERFYCGVIRNIML